MKGCRLFWYEIRAGWNRQRLYWLAIPLYMLSALIFSGQILVPCRLDFPEINPNIGDIILFLFCGKEPVLWGNSARDFQIPVVWIVLLLGSSLSVIGYAEYFTVYGQQYFIRCKKRWVWWLSKCVWNACTTCIYFGLGFFSLILISLKSGWKIDLSNTPELFPYIFRGVTDKPMQINSSQTLRAVFFVVAGCISWNLFQMFVAMYVKCFVSIMMTSIMLLCSVYIYSAFVPGNHLMLLRNSMIMPGGLEICNGLWLFGSLALLSVFGGMLKISKVDYLPEEQE